MSAKRRLVTLGLTSLVIVGAFASWAWFGLLGGGSPVPQASIEGLVARDADSPPDSGDEQDGSDDGEPGVVNVLVAGSDSRAGLSRGEARELSLGEVGGARADAIMLVQMRTDGSDAAILSIPRDLRVENCDGATGRINASFAIAESRGEEGGSCLVDTVTRITGVSVHHYVEIDVIGFMDVVDTLGGVEMCFDRPTRDAKAGLDMPEGCHRLDGADALSFVRARSIDGSGDFGRMQRQQKFLKRLAEEVSDGASVANVPRMLRVLEDLEEAVTTDETLGLGTMRSLATAFRDASADDIVSVTVPGDAETIGGASYVVMREDEAERLFAAFRDGRGRDFVDRATARDDG